MAQVSRASLLTSIATNLPDNTSAEISPADVRGELVNQADSSVFRTTNKTSGPTANDDGAGTGGNGIFGVGDIWVDETNNAAYIALDVTTSTAVWDSFGGSLAVTKIGTPVNNQVAVWQSAGEIEGDTGLTYTTGQLVVNAATPILELYDNDAPANNQRWQTLSYGGTYKIQGVSGAGALGTSFVQITRTNENVTGLALTTSGVARTTVSQNAIDFGVAASTIQTDGAYDLSLGVNAANLLVLGGTNNDLTMVGQGANATTFNLGDTALSTGDAAIQVGNGRTGDGISYIDLIADSATYTDYGLRLIRNAGENGTGQLIHRGTGDLSIITDEAAGIVFQTNSLPALTLSATQGAAFGGSISVSTFSPSSTITSTNTSTYTVTGVTQASPAVVSVSSTADMTTGDAVTFADVVGMTELNGNTYKVVVLGGVSFQLVGVDSTGFTAYTSGGTATREPVVHSTRVIDTGAPIGPSTIVGNESLHNLVLTTGGQPRITIDTMGYVGIGTNFPDTTVVLNSDTPTLRFNDITASNIGDISVNDSTMTFVIDEAAAQASSGFEWRVDGVTQMTLTNAGLNITGGLTSNPAITAVATSRTLALTDAGDILEINTSGGAVVVTIPTNATVAFPIGTLITISLIDITAAATITAAGGVTLNGVVAGSGVITATAFNGVTLYKRATDEWVVQGAIAAVA